MKGRQHHVLEGGLVGRVAHQLVKDMTILGNQIWQSNEFYGVDGTSRGGLGRQLRRTKADGQDGLDEPDGPVEPVAQVRVLPEELCILADQKATMVRLRKVHHRGPY